MAIGVRVFEGKDMVDIKEVISEIKKLGKQYREQNGNSPLPTNKDFNLWLVTQLMDLKIDVAANKAKIKMLCVILPILITIVKII